MADTVVPHQNGITAPEIKEPSANANGDVDPDNAEPNGSDPPSTPVDKITFAAPLSEASPPPFTTSHPVTAEPSAPPIQDHLPPPSPHTVPLPRAPTTPTPSRV